MKDEIGKIPKITSKIEAIKEIIKICNDKREHILIIDQCEWLDLKIKAIAMIANKVLKQKDR